MSFFDERVEAYRRYVGNARDDVDAARGRYEMACDETAVKVTANTERYGRLFEGQWGTSFLVMPVRVK